MLRLINLILLQYDYGTSKCTQLHLKRLQCKNLTYETLVSFEYLFDKTVIIIAFHKRIVFKLTRGIVVTGVLSRCSHSIFGVGLPLATQST